MGKLTQGNYQNSIGRNVIAYGLWSMSILGFGCEVPATAESEQESEIHRPVTVTEASDVDAPSMDEIVPAKVAEPERPSSYMCTGNGGLCIGQCQGGGGPYSFGDRATVGYGHCAPTVKNWCRVHHYGDVILACWGE